MQGMDLLDIKVSLCHPLPICLFSGALQLVMSPAPQLMLACR